MKNKKEELGLAKFLLAIEYGWQLCDKGYNKEAAIEEGKKLWESNPAPKKG